MCGLMDPLSFWVNGSTQRVFYQFSSSPTVPPLSGFSTRKAIGDVPFGSFVWPFITLRRERDLTQQQMADAIGVHVNKVHRYEAGATQPSLDAVKKIAVAMSSLTPMLHTSFRFFWMLKCSATLPTKRLFGYYVSGEQVNR